MKIALLTTDSREHFKEYDNPAPYFGTAPQALLEGFAKLPSIEVHVVSCLQKPTPSPARLASNIAYHGLTVPKIGWLRTAYSGCIQAVRARLRQIRPDIVHGQGTERDCALSAILSGFPNVLTIHGNMRLVAKLNRARPFSAPWLSARLERLTIPRSDGVICITRYTQDAVVSLARRTWLLPNAVDGSFFGVRPQVGPLPILLCVGLICARKNQNRFIRALDAVARRNRFEAVFLGHLPEDSYGREFRALLSDRPWARYAGFADRDSLREWFGRASVLALPSLEDNCPMAVLEAMAAGVPVMAANVGGVPDLVEDRLTGLLCDPLDEADMARAVAALLDHPALAAAVAGNARRQAEERFHPKVVARRHLEIYREVLSSRE